MEKIKIVCWIGCMILASTIAVPVIYGLEALHLPQTGQKNCYRSSGVEIDCKGTRQDGEVRSGIAWPDPRFTNLDGSTPLIGSVAIDRLTGLMWTRDAGTPTIGSCAGSPKEWPGAMEYVKCLNRENYMGYSDWRLPNINEMESLVNAEASGVDVWLNSKGFINVRPDPYWTSTASDGTPVDVWNIFFLSGLISTSYKWTYKYYVWPVRTGPSVGAPAPLWKTGQTHSFRTGDDGDLRNGISWPDPRFIDHQDGTVIDNLTGLMWTKDANAPGPASCSSAKTWQGAFDYVGCLNIHHFLGYKDWRLPNKKELFSLFDYSMNRPVLPAGHPFSAVRSGRYWTSTTFANSPDCAWAVNLSSGTAGAASKSSSKDERVWPVRSGLIGNAGIDLTGTWVSLIQTCKDGGSRLKCKILAKLNIQNTGIKEAPSTFVKFYLSETGDPDGELDFLGKIETGAMKGRGNKVKAWNHVFPPGKTGDGQYVIAVIDPDHTLAETDRKNNSIVFGPIR